MLDMYNFFSKKKCSSFKLIHGTKTILCKFMKERKYYPNSLIESIHKK